ncbi:MAG: hypothetical protein LBD02_10750 [Christensenellaceae bacterium]|jgi:hypothetical protein|nr:hypothetical protein [Christensenellaceae bacterium]
MTAQNVVYSALAVISEAREEAGNYEAEVLIGQINILLGEYFSIQNALMKRRGANPFAEPPEIADLSDDISYDWQLTRMVLPYRLAGYIVLDDEEFSKMNWFMAQAEINLRSAVPAREEPIIDVYGG